MLSVERFIQETNLSRELAKELRQYFQRNGEETGSNSNQGKDVGAEILRQLSHSLQVEVTKALNQKLMEQVPLLDGTTEQFKLGLSVVLWEEHFEPDTYVYRRATGSLLARVQRICAK